MRYGRHGGNRDNAKTMPNLFCKFKNMSRKEDRKTEAIIKATIAVAVIATIIMPALIGWKLLIINLPLVIGMIYAWWKSMENSIEESEAILKWGTIIIAFAMAIEVAITVNEFMDNLPTFFQPKQPQ